MTFIRSSISDRTMLISVSIWSSCVLLDWRGSAAHHLSSAYPRIVGDKYIRHRKTDGMSDAVVLCPDGLDDGG